MHHNLNTLFGYAVIRYGRAAHGGVMKHVLHTYGPYGPYGSVQGILYIT